MPRWSSIIVSDQSLKRFQRCIEEEESDLLDRIERERILIAQSEARIREMTMQQMNRSLWSLDDLFLTNRTYNCLRDANIRTVGDLECWTGGDLLRVKNLGRVTAQEVKALLQALDRQLKD